MEEQGKKTGNYITTSFTGVSHLKENCHGMNNQDTK